MRGGSESFTDMLRRAGLDVVEVGAAPPEVLSPQAAWHAAMAGERGAACTVRADGPDAVDEVNAWWHRLATECGIVAADGTFLLDVGGRPVRWESRLWRRVRLVDGWDLAGVLGERGFMAIAATGDALVGVTRAGDEVRVVTLDRIRARREAAVRAAVSETPGQRDAAWAELFRAPGPAEGLRDVWAEGVVLNPGTPHDLYPALLGFSSRLLYQKLPEALVEAAMAHPDWKVRGLLAEVQPNLTVEQRSRMILDEEDPRRRWMLTLLAGDLRAELTEPLYEKLATESSARVRGEATRLPGMPAHLLTALAEDDDATVRLSACGRAWPHLDGDGRQRLLDDPDAGVRADALILFHREHPMPRAVFDAQDVGKRALEECRLERDLAEHLVRHGESHQRRSLAANPRLDPDLVLLLARDPDASVRFAVSVRSDLTEEQRAAVAIDFDPRTHHYALEWVVARHGDPAEMRRLAASTHPLVRRSVARARHLPPDVVRRLARDEDRVVQLFLAESCDDAPAEMLLRVWQWWTGSLSTPDRPHGHPNFPRRGLLRHADDPNPRMRRLALDDPESTAELVERFSHDASGEVRYRAATDPRLTVAAAVRLLDDPGGDVRSAAAAHPGLPARVLVRMLRAPETAAAAARHPALPVPVIRRMVGWIRTPAADGGDAGTG